MPPIFRAFFVIYAKSKQAFEFGFLYNPKYAALVWAKNLFKNKTKWKKNHDYTGLGFGFDFGSCIGTALGLGFDLIEYFKLVLAKFYVLHFFVIKHQIMIGIFYCSSTFLQQQLLLRYKNYFFSGLNALYIKSFWLYFKFYFSLFVESKGYLDDWLNLVELH